MNNLKQENDNLRKRLEALQQSDMSKVKKNKVLFRKPMTRKAFTKENPQFQDVSSQIDYDLIMERKKQKIDEVNQKKIELEFQGCTFQPTINNKSRKMADNTQHIFDRQLPQKQPSPPPREEEGLEEVIDPHPKRKFNEKFYEKQLQWKRLKTDGWNKMRMNRTLEEMNKASHKPKTNKKKNQQLVKQNGDFLERMQKQKQKADKKIEIMKQQQDNENSFKPAINRNKKAKAQVFDHPSGLYKTIKKPLKVLRESVFFVMNRVTIKEIVLKAKKEVIRVYVVITVNNLVILQMIVKMKDKKDNMMLQLSKIWTFCKRLQRLTKRQLKQRQQEFQVL